MPAGRRERDGGDGRMTTPPLPAAILARAGLPAAEVAVHWHQRFEADPGNRWLREQVIALFAS